MPALADAVELSLWPSLKATAGISVSYTQGVTTKTVTVVPGRTRTTVETQSGIARSDRLNDWIVEAADLALTPLRADTIVWGTRKFEVMNPSGTRVFDNCDQYGKLLRIHTKEVYAS